MNCNEHFSNIIENILDNLIGYNKNDVEEILSIKFKNGTTDIFGTTEYEDTDIGLSHSIIFVFDENNNLKEYGYCNFIRDFD